MPSCIPAALWNKVSEVLDQPLHPIRRDRQPSSNNRRGQRLRQIPGMTPTAPDVGLRVAARCTRQRFACNVLKPPEPTSGHLLLFHPAATTRIRWQPPRGIMDKQHRW